MYSLKDFDAIYLARKGLSTSPLLPNEKCPLTSEKSFFMASLTAVEGQWGELIYPTPPPPCSNGQCQLSGNMVVRDWRIRDISWKIRTPKNYKKNIS